MGVSPFAPSDAKTLWPVLTACITACAASMQRGISCESTCSAWWRMSSRTVVTSTTSSMLICRASLRLRGTVLSHSEDKAGEIQWSTEYARASRSWSNGVGGLIDLMASLRIEAKPQRVERCSTDFHCSYERLCSSKSLADVCTSIINQRDRAFQLTPDITQKGTPRNLCIPHLLMIL